MTKRLPFTALAVERAIRGVKQAGHFVVGVKPDGTLIVAVPMDAQPSPPSARRFGEKLDGDQSEA